MSIGLPDASQVAALRRDYMQRAPRRGRSCAGSLPPVRPLVPGGDRLRGDRRTERDGAFDRLSARPASRPGSCCSRASMRRAFVFFTNYCSEKGRDLEANPRAALTFGWIEQERQVRIEGAVSQMPRSAVETYFETRPRGSRLGAWASNQSDVIPNRAFLEARLAEGGGPLYRGRSTPGDLGRLSPRTGADRILAGPYQPASRPAPLPEERRGVDHRAACPVRKLPRRAAAIPFAVSTRRADGAFLEKGDTDMGDDLITNRKAHRDYQSSRPTRPASSCAARRSSRCGRPGQSHRCLRAHREQRGVAL